MGMESIPNQEGQSFEAWLANRPKTKEALEAMCNNGWIQGDFETMVSTVNKPDDVKAIYTLVGEYLENQEAKNRPGMMEAAKKIDKIVDTYF